MVKAGVGGGSDGQTFLLHTVHFSEKSTGEMVFFSCDGCGDMLKKSQVDAHVYKCKVGCNAVSCVDCSVSFYGGTKHLFLST